MQGNILGGGGTNVNNSLFPIYQQVMEPVVKKGIWIKSSENIKNVYFQEDLIREEELIDTATFVQDNYIMLGVGENIFAIDKSTRSSAGTIKIYRYSLNNNLSTLVASISIEASVIAVNIDTDIYIFAIGGDDDGQVYKFNTLDNTYTQLLTNAFSNISAADYSDMLCVVGTYIYYAELFKYDITNNIFTKLSGTHYILQNAECAKSVDEDIYIFGVKPTNGNRYRYVYKYNISVDEYTKINGYIEDCYSITQIDKMFYLVCRDDNSLATENFLDTILKYDARKNLFYKYALFQNDNKSYSILNVKNKIYRIYNYKNLYLVKNKIQNEGDGIYIVTNENILNKNMSMQSIVDVKKIISGEEQSIEAYVGNGIEWKLLN